MIWNLRLEELERKILVKWKSFTIWNAGKQGRKFYKSLSEESKNKVVAFCDVDSHKIGKKFHHYDSARRLNLREVSIKHFRDAKPPFIICVKMVNDTSSKRNICF